MLVSHWSLQFQLKLVWIGARTVSTSSKIVFHMAEVPVPKKLFQSIQSRIHRIGKACARAPVLSL